MKRPPAWLVWTGATIVLWVIWVTMMSATIQRSLSSLAIEQRTLQSETAKATTMLADAPIVAARLDSLHESLDKTTKTFVSVNELRQLEQALERPARDHGIASFAASLELNSVLDLRHIMPDTIPQLDTVLIEFSARGDFRRIGMWLDDIEERVDFTQWRRAHWERGADNDAAAFQGTAAFWVVVNRSEKSAANTE